MVGLKQQHLNILAILAIFEEFLVCCYGKAATIATKACEYIYGSKSHPVAKFGIDRINRSKVMNIYMSYFVMVWCQNFLPAFSLSLLLKKYSII